MVRGVQLFLEKPSRADATAMKASGGLWNTMIVAARVRTLWQLGWGLFPEVLSLFEKLREAIDTSREGAVLDGIYEVMPSWNFSVDLLSRATKQVAVMPTEGILWSDWGRAERIIETLRRVGRQPNFSMITADRRVFPAESSDSLDTKVSLFAGSMADQRQDPPSALVRGSIQKSSEITADADSAPTLP